MIFFSRKPKTSALPPGWPSPYHNKCSQRDCLFSNSPQTTKGVYQCRGVPGGFFCEGTYKISSSRAQETERYLKEMAMARRAAEEEQRKRTISEMRRPDMNARRRGRDTPVYVVSTDDRARRGYTQAPRHSHAHPVKSNDGRPQVASQRRPSMAGNRPTSSQIETEFIQDQIMMHLYPEQRIQPRW
ncbi:hypothetical protein BDN67DRAFT_1012250 [Paxillus ammoniavirescens]|nr:hypothetical protein BDN67DRAFT_1012250 [Paxillus ammoniavirescens]